MAKKTRMSKLSQKLEEAGVERVVRHEKAKVPGGGTLPAGINGGIAKLTRVDFDIIEGEKNKGEQRCYAHGIAVFPETFVDKNGNTHTVKGRLVQMRQVVLADTVSTYEGTTTERSFEENLAKAENNLKLLGFPTEEFDDLEAETLEYFAEEGDNMYFKFRTWGDDRVNITIEGPAVGYVPGESGEDSDGVEDDTDDAPPAKNDKTPKASTSGGKKTSSKNVKAEEPEDDESDDSDDEEEETTDLDSLAKKANKGDKPSQIAIAKEAKKNDIDPEDEEYEDWTDVVNAIKKAGKSSSKKKTVVEEPEEEEAGGEEELVPEKGLVYGYKPKGSRKLKEFEVTKVLKRTKTVSLKGVDSDETFEDVSWDDLVEVEA